MHGNVHQKVRKKTGLESSCQFVVLGSQFLMSLNSERREDLFQSFGIHE
jgi:hypothetical protein